MQASLGQVVDFALADDAAEDYFTDNFFVEEFMGKFYFTVSNLEVLKWLRKENDPPCPWDEWTRVFATIKDHLEVLKWLRYEGCP